MLTRRFHQAVSLESSFKSEEIDESFRAIGFVPLDEMVSKYIREKLPWVAPLASLSNPMSLRSVIFINPERNQLVAYRAHSDSLRLGPSEPANEGLDFLMASEGEWNAEQWSEVTTRICELGQAPLDSGSTIEQAHKESISNRIQKLSPNGRKLSDDDFLEECHKLFDDGIREDLFTLHRTHQEQPVTKDMIARIDRFAADPSRLNRLLANDQAVTVSYGAECIICKEPSLLFDSRDRCESVIADNHPICANCRGQDFQTVELYRGRKVLLDALRQGLWLEALALGALRKRTDPACVWAGQMAGSDEVDAIAVFADEVILLECKDTSFGLNEFYVARTKAENLGASKIGILTTNDLHPNVEASIKEANENRQAYIAQRPRRYRVISMSSANQIQAALDKWLVAMEEQVIKGWFGSVRLPAHLLNYPW